MSEVTRWRVQCSWIPVRFACASPKFCLVVKSTVCADPLNSPTCYDYCCFASCGCGWACLHTAFDDGSRSQIYNALSMFGHCLCVNIWTRLNKPQRKEWSDMVKSSRFLPALAKFVLSS